MQAVLVDEPGGPENLRLGEHEKPVPGDEELLVKVHATALNRADILQRKGQYPPPPHASPLLGLEMAGLVEEVGDRCINWNEGDRVFGLLSGGGYAEYAVIHQDMAMAIPPDLPFVEAAAVPEVFLTAYQALHWLGDVQAGKHVLIHAGGSGVGTAAIQLTKEAGAHPYITASAPKHNRCRALGAELAVNYKEEGFVDPVLEATKGKGADIVLDFVGAPYFQDNVEVLAADGRLVLLATLGGDELASFNLRRLFAKRAHLIATTLRSRSQGYKIELSEDFAADVLPHFIDGTLEPVIDSVYDWSDVAEAHRRMEANENLGKIVLRVNAG